jgi:hypothetical protein
VIRGEEGFISVPLSLLGGATELSSYQVVLGLYPARAPSRFERRSRRYLHGSLLSATPIYKLYSGSHYSATPIIKYIQAIRAGVFEVECLQKTNSGKKTTHTRGII